MQPTQLEFELRAKVRQMLTDGEIDCFIGYETSRNPYACRPAFIRKPEDVDRLVWTPFCNSNLGKYLLDFKGYDGKVGIAVRGCDSKSVVRLVKDNQLNRDKVVIVGLPCDGMAVPTALPEVPRNTVISWELTDGQLTLDLPSGKVKLEAAKVFESRCSMCTSPIPVMPDVTIGQAAATAQIDRNMLFADVASIEAMDSAERRSFWQEQFSKCIRCYACRNSCPACNCRECCFDAADTKWLGKGVSTDENEVFHLTRAFHVAGRCTGCGECDKACPVGIPIRLLNKKVAKDMAELFGTMAPGSKLDEEVPFRTFSYEDPEEFM